MTSGLLSQYPLKNCSFSTGPMSQSSEGPPPGFAAESFSVSTANSAGVDSIEDWLAIRSSVCDAGILQTLQGTTVASRFQVLISGRLAPRFLFIRIRRFLLIGIGRFLLIWIGRLLLIWIGARFGL